MTNFDIALSLIFEHEGGLVDHPRDPGGITNYGISLRSYPDLGRDGILGLTREKAADIYRRDYWDRIRGDELPLALAIVTMDAAVNSGVSRAVRWLQQALGVKTDGVIGPDTLVAVRTDHIDQVCAESIVLRLRFLAGLDTWSTFGKGWSRRIVKTALVCGEHMTGERAN